MTKKKDLKLRAVYCFSFLRSTALYSYEIPTHQPRIKLKNITLKKGLFNIVSAANFKGYFQIVSSTSGLS
ncbi:hypothetical protein EUGRSUZ_C00043 [Eucalyptus grandis]|uniref:Uncharacterized protein n=2 Tax=Eucalyptus grandis TaxID=71139 RepID=A0ACC3L9E7_EUCGR|nr:hypothetical protein EUGRSUZ_C00043 [Eucalyptus grandis]